MKPRSAPEEKAVGRQGPRAGKGRGRRPDPNQLHDLTYPGEIARFQVFPAGRRSPHYWVVMVFADKGHVRRAYRRLAVASDRDNRFGAVVLPLVRQQLIHGRWRNTDPFLGYALFARTQLHMETQAHEAVHMATSYLRRVQQSLRLAGRCAAQLNSNFHRLCCYRK